MAEKKGFSFLNKKEAEKTQVKTEKKSDKAKPVVVEKRSNKPAVQSAPPKTNRVQKIWRETIGELRKVTWPTPQEAWKLTRVVLLVMVFMSAVLGIFDFIFSKAITALLAL